MALQLDPKEFANKVNHCLDEMDAPKLEKKRVDILSDLLDMSKFEAQSLLSGRIMPHDELIDKIAAEFDVDRDWLAGKSRDNPSPSR